MLSTQHQGRFQRRSQAYIQHVVRWHTNAIAQLPRWRHSLIGYLVGLLLVGLGLGVGVLETRLLFPFSFPGVPLLFAITLVAMLWGVGPAIFAMLLSLLVLDYWYVPPFGTLGAYGWSGMLQLLTFASAGITVALLTHQREVARVRARVAEREAVQREHAEARANELALREANRRMEEFLSIICHELKTPLTIMRGSLQLAERKVKRLVSSEALLPDEMQRFASILELLKHARNQVGLQDRLVNDLLDASRIQAQTLQLLMTPCNLVSIVQEAIEDQRQIVPVRAIHLETPAGKDVAVHGDADRLLQVVTNYLTNALKYSSADLPVEVRLRVKGRIAQVSVCDEGPGLPAAEHERIWERFYRVPGIEVQSGCGEGLGVGLYVCRTIIERHGGQVGVDSRPGKGSTFWFTLPLARHGNMDEETVV